MVEHFLLYQNKRKEINKRTYDKTATYSNQTLGKGENVWYKKNHVWTPGQVMEICNEPRSGIVKNE